MVAYTNAHHTKRAFDFYNATYTKYVGLGRTTEWVDPDNPPAESVTATNVDEPIMYKPITLQSFIIPDSNGAIIWNNQNWTTINSSDAYTNNARHIYVLCKFTFNDTPLTTFRQAGFFTSLVPVTGAGSGLLLPADVSDVGKLEILSNVKAEPRSSNSTITIAFIMIF